MIEHTFSYPFQLEIDAIVVKKRIHAREAKEINPQSLLYLIDSKPSVLELVTPDLVKFNHFTCIFIFWFVRFSNVAIFGQLPQPLHGLPKLISTPIIWLENIILTLFGAQNSENRNTIELFVKCSSFVVYTFNITFKLFTYNLCEYTVTVYIYYILIL